MTVTDVERLRSIKTFEQLVAYLRDELDWPIDTEDFDSLTFDYEAEELGLDAKAAVKVKFIKQLLQSPITPSRVGGRQRTVFGAVPRGYMQFHRG